MFSFKCLIRGKMCYYQLIHMQLTILKILWCFMQKTALSFIIDNKDLNGYMTIKKKLFVNNISLLSRWPTTQ